MYRLKLSLQQYKSCPVTTSLELCPVVKKTDSELRSNVFLFTSWIINKDQMAVVYNKVQIVQETNFTVSILMHISDDSQANANTPRDMFSVCVNILHKIPRLLKANDHFKVISMLIFKLFCSRCKWKLPT